MSELLAIGEVARRAGTTPSALRYYAEIGLLQPTSHVSGHRRYDPADDSDDAVVLSMC